MLINEAKTAGVKLSFNKPVINRHVFADVFNSPDEFNLTQCFMYHLVSSQPLHAFYYVLSAARLYFTHGYLYFYDVCALHWAVAVTQTHPLSILEHLSLLIFALLEVITLTSLLLAFAPKYFWSVQWDEISCGWHEAPHRRTNKSKH